MTSPTPSVPPPKPKPKRKPKPKPKQGKASKPKEPAEPQTSASLSIKTFTEHLDEHLNGSSSFEVRAVIQSILDSGNLPVHHIEAISEVFIEQKSSQKEGETLHWPRTNVSLSLDPSISADAYKKWFKDHVLAASPPMVFDWDSVTETENTNNNNTINNNTDTSGTTNASNQQHLVLKCVMMGGGGDKGMGDKKSARTIWQPPTSERTSRIFRILKKLRIRWLFVSFDMGGKLSALTEAQGVPLSQTVRADKAPLHEIFRKGISLFGVQFEVLSASPSQLRAFTPTAIFIEAGPKAAMSPTQLRQYLFPFPQKKLSGSNLPKLTQSEAFRLVSRIGLYSATDVCWEPLKPSQVAVISDIFAVGDRGDVLTDGCGFITKRLAKKLLISESSSAAAEDPSTRRGNSEHREQHGIPSLVQFRYSGMKGVLLVLDDNAFIDVLAKSDAKSLTVDKNEKPCAFADKLSCEVMVRQSQIKFSKSCSDDFCVVRTSAEAGAFTLNREIINLMISLKARSTSSLVSEPSTSRNGAGDENPQDAFENYVLEQLERIQQFTLGAALGGADAARSLIWSSAPLFAREWDAHAMLTSAECSPHRNVYEEPFVLKLLAATMSKIWSQFRFRFRIPFGQGCKLLGCADPFGRLGDGEIFAKIRVIEDSRDPNVYYRFGSLEAEELISMGLGIEKVKCISSEQALVCRNPCVHPGDIQICRAVDLSAVDPRYGEFINVVFFPCSASTTTYSVPHRCSGGDLDGDEFSITWDPNFASSMQQYPSFSYDEEKPIASGKRVEEKQAVAECMEICMNNTALLGSISNIHASACEFLTPKRACHPDCISLVKALSLAMDFPKKGIPPVISQEVKDVIQISGYPIYIRGASKKLLRAHSLLTTIFMKSKMPYFIDHFRRGPLQDPQRETVWATALDKGLQKALSFESSSTSSAKPLDSAVGDGNLTTASHSAVLLNHCSQLWCALRAAASDLRAVMTDCHLKCESELFVGCIETSDPLTSGKSVLARESQAGRVSSILQTLRKELAVVSISSGGMTPILKGLFVYVCSHYPIAAHMVLTRVFGSEAGYKQLTTFMSPLGLPLDEKKIVSEANRGGNGNADVAFGQRPNIDQKNDDHNESKNNLSLNKSKEYAHFSGFSCLAWSCAVDLREFFDAWSKRGVEGLFPNPARRRRRAAKTKKEMCDHSTQNSTNSTDTGNKKSIDTIAKEILDALDGVFTDHESGKLHCDATSASPSRCDNTLSPSAAIFSRIQKEIEAEGGVKTRTNGAQKSKGLTLREWRHFLNSEGKGLVVALRVVLDWASDTITELKSFVLDHSSSNKDEENNGTSSTSISTPTTDLQHVVAKNNELFSIIRNFIERIALANKSANPFLRRRYAFKLSPNVSKGERGPSDSKMPAKRYWALQISVLIAPFLSLFDRSGGSAQEVARISQLRLLRADDPFALLRNNENNDNDTNNDEISSSSSTGLKFSLKEIWNSFLKENSPLKQLQMPVTTNGRGWHHDQGTHFFFPSPLWEGLTATSEEEEAAACAATAVKQHIRNQCRLSLLTTPRAETSLAETSLVRSSCIQRSAYISSILSPLWSAIQRNFNTKETALYRPPAEDVETRRWRVSCRFGKQIIVNGVASLPSSESESWTMETLSSLASNRFDRGNLPKAHSSHRVRFKILDPTADLPNKKEKMIKAVAPDRSFSPSPAHRRSEDNKEGTTAHGRESKKQKSKLILFKDTFETVGTLPSLKGKAKGSNESLVPCDDILRFIHKATVSGWHISKKCGATVCPSSEPQREFANSNSNSTPSKSGSGWVVRLSLKALYGQNLQIDLDERKCIIDVSHQNHSHGKLVLLAPAYKCTSSDTDGTPCAHASFPFPSPFQKDGEVLVPGEADIRLNFQICGFQPCNEVLRATNCAALDKCFSEMGITSGSTLDIFDDESWAGILQNFENSRLLLQTEAQCAFEGALSNPLPKLKFRSSIPREFVTSVYHVRISTGWLLFQNPQEFPRITLRMTRRSLDYSLDGSGANPTSYQYPLKKVLPFEMDLSVGDNMSGSSEWRDIEGPVEEGMRSCLAGAVSIQEMLMSLEV